MTNQALSTAQRLDADSIVSLYQIDATSIPGGTVMYFTTGTMTGPLQPQVITNPCCEVNTTGWSFSGTAPPATTDSTPAYGAIGTPFGAGVGVGFLWPYALRDCGSGYMHRSAGISAGSYMDASWAAHTPVVVGQTYEWQALVEAHRCQVYLVLAFYSASSSLISVITSAPVDNVYGPAEGQTEGAYTLLFARGAAPAGASFCIGYIRAVGNGGIANPSGSEPYVIFSKAFLGGPVAADLVLPTPWVPFQPNGQVAFGGNIYTPIPVELTGFEWSGRGTMPRPIIRVTNINNIAGQLAIQLGDLLGAKLSRTRTFVRYLDNMPTADPAACFEPDIWFFDRKAAHNPTYIEWELASILDQEGRKLPGRQMIRDVCSHTYRHWDPSLSDGTGGFSYTGVTCPYTGDSFWDQTDGATFDATADACGKRLTSCRNRFPNQALPTWAFPGMVRVGA